MIKSADRLLTTAEAARQLNVSESFLAKARVSGIGPAYVKLGKAVRYPQSSLDHYLRAQQRLSTAQ